MIAVDANILLELLENRSRAQKVLEAIANHASVGESFAISTLTASNVFYLAEAHKLPMKKVEEFVQKYILYCVDSSDVDWALAHYDRKDFEDALQISAALQQNCKLFMTLDINLAKKYNKFLPIELIR